MNRTLSTKANSIAENCRSILRERCCIQQTCNHTHGCDGIISQQYVNGCYEKSSYCNTVPPIECGIDGNIAPMKPILNKQTSHVQYLSVPSSSCIQMITNSTITKIRYKVSPQELALLRCCLPSLIRQIMCKSPWLTPNDVIRWLSEDIIKEAMNSFAEDNLSLKSHDNENDSLSSYRGRNSQKPILSQHSSRSILNTPNKIPRKQTKSENDERTKRNEQHTPSTHSFNSQQSVDLDSNSYSSTALSPRNEEDRNKKSNQINEEDEKSVSTANNEMTMNTFDSRDNFDSKTVDLNPKLDTDNRLSRTRIEFPGKKDPNAIEDVQKCLAFYQKIQEYFDDDIAAMLLKCCLCYGDCSGKR